MTNEALKKRIIELLGRKTERYLLTEVHDMLASGTSGKALKARLEAAVLAGEADIAHGRTMDLATFEKRIKASLRSKIAARPSGRDRA